MTKSKKDFIKWFLFDGRTSALNIIIWSIFAFFIIDLTWAPWIDFKETPWSIFNSNVLYDILFARSGGPILYGNHVSSSIAILAVTAYFMLRKASIAYKSFFIVLATVPIHEFILDTIMGPGTNWTGLNEIAYTTGFFVLNLRWLFWLSLFLFLGIYFAKSEQRKTLLKISVVIAIYCFAWWSYISLTHHSPWTLEEYSPGLMLLDTTDNLLEVFGWIIPMSIWLLPDSGTFSNPLNLIRSLTYRIRRSSIKMDSESRFQFFKERKEWENEYLPDFSLKGKTVLDVGAGCGETAYFFFQHGASKVISVEPDENKIRFLRYNAQKMNWNIEIIQDRFSLSHMRLNFDYAKIDCEDAEYILLELESLPPLSLEIHTIELMKAFRYRFPRMVIKQKYHRPFRTWIGKNKFI